jgi:hypothetical protein
MIGHVPLAAQSTDALGSPSFWQIGGSPPPPPPPPQPFNSSNSKIGKRIEGQRRVAAVVDCVFISHSLLTPLHAQTKFGYVGTDGSRTTIAPSCTVASFSVETADRRESGIDHARVPRLPRSI